MAAVAQGPLLAQLAIAIDGHDVLTPAIWVIDERKLTQESGEDDGRSRQQRVERTGEDLVELLDEIGEQGGASAVADCLRHILIRFDDGAQGRGFGRRFRIAVRDPFHFDRIPDWLIAGSGADSIPSAVLDFADRHRANRLRRHAERGNVNGMSNFLDILRACVRVLYVFYRRGSTAAPGTTGTAPSVVKRGDLIDRFTDYLFLTTVGYEYDDGTAENGYLYSVAENLEGSLELLQEACRETNLAGELRALLLLLQHVRLRPDEASLSRRGPRRPRECFPEYSRVIADSLADIEVDEPSVDQVRQALHAYRMLPNAEIEAMLGEL